MDQRQIRTVTTTKIIVRGRVQGVGFRPFVANLAKKYELNGTVQNNLDGVYIVLQGEKVASFLADLQQKAPRLCRIDEVEVETTTSASFASFSIIPSEEHGFSRLVIPVDAAVCPDCLQEMNDPTNRRYRYPFITCTQCGPRYTMIQSLPYDRERTSMATFSMCPNCEQEYTDSTNRRYHAEPIACETCGPVVSFWTIEKGHLADGEAAIQETIRQLQAGAIVAIKGIGGYHLACDATNEEAVYRLRVRKRRPNKPFAVMAASLAETRSFAYVSPEEEALLTSSEAPIVVLDLKQPFHALAPQLQTIGVMLPYTPLHHLMMEKFSLLVMTSANVSGLPMVYDEQAAFTQLLGIADFVLTHNRPIVHPLDDSVVKKGLFLRRARGYVPDGLMVDVDVNQVVALGSQQKNTFALGRNNQVFLGPHIGDLQSQEVMDHFQNELDHIRHWMGMDHSIIAVDAHPGFATQSLATQMGGEVVEVQHHHAHFVACLAENNVDTLSYGIILDGTGYGLDGNIWGFECVYGNAAHFERLGHLAYTPLAGGEKAIVEPWRNAVSMLVFFFGEEGKQMAYERFPEKRAAIDIIAHMVEKNLNAPLAGTCGRLFDAVSAFLGLCEVSTYDGEAAIVLSEQMVHYERKKERPYSFSMERVAGVDEINVKSMWKEIMADINTGQTTTTIIARFHETIIQAIVCMVKRQTKQTKQVALSGGSFHNEYLRKHLKEALQQAGYDVLEHKQVPPSDGGLSFGQLMIAKGRSV